MEQVLYVSALASKRLFNKLLASADKEKPSQPAQKFNFLIAKGMRDNGTNVTCLTGLPVSRRSHPNASSVSEKDELEDGICYHYPSFLNKPLPKFLKFLISSFIYTIKWGWKNKKTKHAVFVDVLCLPMLMGCMAASKLMGIKTFGVITDLPGLIAGNSSMSGRMIARLSNFLIESMTGKIPLTEQMCNVINKRHKPYLVMEGLCDSNMAEKKRVLPSDGKRHITYTGAIHKIYGLDILAQGFMMTEIPDIVLDIYGSGDMAETLIEYQKKDPRIVYHGTVPIEDAVAAQLQSYLLVNPRPTKEEFTKYSFPSKTMEYMSSGVPLLTTKLPGIPKDYFPYLYFIDREDARGIEEALTNILAESEADNIKRGEEAKKFVIQKKNNIAQTKRILEFMDALI